MTTVPGLELPRVTSWLDRTLPGLRAGELRAELITGGKSNLTYRVSDGHAVWALRRPPLAHVLPTAHDMVREYTVISALAGTAVPVPRALALCTDVEVTGAPFYLMSFVDGVVFDREPAVRALTAGEARRIGELLVDTLAALHAVSPAAVGLAGFGRPEGYLQRQIRRWHEQWRASQTRPLPILHEVVEALDAALPTSGSPTIVHGDYRATNAIYARGLQHIAAVVDWEMATLGDPLADVGLLVVYHSLAAAGGATMPRMSPDDGFLSPREMVGRYTSASGRDVSALDWYVGFGFFKLAVVAEGIAARHLRGKTVGDGFEWFGPAVPGLLEQARDAVHGSGAGRWR